MKWLVAAIVVVAIAVLLAVASRQSATPGVPLESAAAQVATPALTTPATCHLNGALPDPACTPGAANPAVTQTNVASTICVAGYSARIRPPSSYTDSLKVQQMRAYGLTGTTADYEEDHLIPLEVGGDPRNPRNLWPEPRGGEPNAGEKNRLENFLHGQVCAGRMALVDAQHAIATDWVSAWNAAGRP
jgi:hypothetical protein